MMGHLATVPCGITVLCLSVCTAATHAEYMCFDEFEAHVFESPPRSPVLGDLNGDGHLDAVVVHTQAGEISVAYGDGEGAFGDMIRIPVDNPAS